MEDAVGRPHFRHTAVQPDEASRGHILGQERRGRWEQGVTVPRDLPAQIGVVSEHELAAFEQNAAKHRGYRALARPIEQRNPEGAFQRSNPASEIRLRSIHLLGSPREVAVAPERNGEADESELIHDTKSVSQCIGLDIGHISAPVKYCWTFFDSITPNAERVSQIGRFRR
jgi:hypothetical protein